MPGHSTPAPAGGPSGSDPYRAPGGPGQQAGPQHAESAPGPAAPGACWPGGADGTNPYRAPGRPVPSPFSWLRPSDPGPKAPATPRVLAAALVTGLLVSLLVNRGLGVNLLICGVAAAVGAGLAARSAGRRVRGWTLLWSALALALLAVPALSDAGWPTMLSTLCALGLASLALHGGRRWPGVLLALPGILWQLVPG
ncbi:DUF4173 domain-containing protein, partial [Kitasatospora sp. NPDC058263]